MTTLLDAVRRHALAHANEIGLAPTPIPGLLNVTASAVSDLIHAVSRPLVCLVVQGSKRVTLGTEEFVFSAGDSLVISADVPTVSQITRASVAVPYFSLVLELDPSLITELTAEMKAAPGGEHVPVRVAPTDRETADAALRLMRLLERPAAIPMLQSQLLREMHYWLLAGRHGPQIRRLGWPDGPIQRVARAIAVLRTDYAETLPVERLASIAGMSTSSFHQHFRAVTSLSPLQFQKHLRLIEARRLMLSENVSSSSAAFAVGYESVSQFTREYGRMFGMSPVKDAKAARGRPQVAA